MIQDNRYRAPLRKFKYSDRIKRGFEYGFDASVKLVQRKQPENLSNSTLKSKIGSELNNQYDSNIVSGFNIKPSSSLQMTRILHRQMKLNVPAIIPTEKRCWDR